MADDLKGAVVVVTGASRGAGKGIAVALGAHRRAVEGVPGCAADLGSPRPVQGDGFPGQSVEAAQGYDAASRGAEPAGNGP